MELRFAVRAEVQMDWKPVVIGLSGCAGVRVVSAADQRFELERWSFGLMQMSAADKVESVTDLLWNIGLPEACTAMGFRSKGLSENFVLQSLYFREVDAMIDSLSGLQFRKEAQLFHGRRLKHWLVLYWDLIAPFRRHFELNNQ
jgi:hypothetical protein